MAGAWPPDKGAQRYAYVEGVGLDYAACGYEGFSNESSC